MSVEADCLTERQRTRMAFRVRLFRSRGYSPERAATWADRLTERDASGDDRRSCIECARLKASGACSPAADGRMPGASTRLTPVTDILGRCAWFEWEKP